MLPRLALAEFAEVSADGQQWTLRLRQAWSSTTARPSTPTT
jgi:hypothetical protein